MFWDNQTNKTEVKVTILDQSFIFGNKKRFASFIESLESSTSQRIYDSNGFLLRAATVCVKDSSESEVKYFKE